MPEPSIGRVRARAGYGLSRDRSEIIVAGVLTVHRVMKALGCKRVLIHSGSIRDGVLAEMFAA